MGRDVWSEDPNERARALQQRSDAVAYDRTPTINALAPLESDPELVLVRRVSDGWVDAKFPDEAAILIASGEYRPFEATESHTAHGTLTNQADPEWVEYGRKERIQALTNLQARREERVKVESDIEAMAARIAALSEEEQARLEAELIESIAGRGSGLIRGPVE